MAIREVQKFQTIDGSLFDTEAQATKHHQLLLENQFGALIDQLTNGIGSIGPGDRLKMLKNAMDKVHPIIAVMESIINTVEFD